MSCHPVATDTYLLLIKIYIKQQQCKMFSSLTSVEINEQQWKNLQFTIYKIWVGQLFTK